MSASPSPASHTEQSPGVTQNAGAATQAAILDQVFGGNDDDDSDLSDDEANVPSHRPAAQAADETQDLDEDHDDDHHDEDMDEDDNDKDVYVPGSVTAAAKIPKFKKTKKHSHDDEDVDDVDEDEGERRPKKRKKEKKRNRRDQDEVDEDDVDRDEEAGPVYDEEELRRRALESRIDNIGKKPKVQRRKKKGDDDVDIVDNFHDEVCAKLREDMIDAAEKDRASNDAKRPAVAKLALLNKVMSILRNNTLWSAIIDNSVLEAVRQWLEPIAPSGALPAVGIQKAFFEILPKMELDTSTLKESRLGPIVLFYSKTKRVTPEINRQADALVQTWSRPIIKRSANFRSRHVNTVSEAAQESRRGTGRNDDYDDEDGTPPPTAAVVDRPKKKRFDANAAIQENAGRKGARLYNNRNVQYSVAPQSHEAGGAAAPHVTRLQNDNERFNRFAKMMKSKAR